MCALSWFRVYVLALCLMIRVDAAYAGLSTNIRLPERFSCIGLFAGVLCERVVVRRGLPHGGRYRYFAWQDAVP